MFTEQFTHSVGSLLQRQGDRLLNRQKTIATVYYSEKSGKLRSSLSERTTPSGLSVEITYPLHIRFLDLKKGKGGKKKKGYEPIYNKYVYGYLYSGIYKALVNGLSGKITAIVTDSIK